MNFPLESDFLLHNASGKKLFEQVASACPILDFHTHLDPVSILNDTVFTEITDLWISSDPYKWRAMRMHGIPEEIITGSRGGPERFAAWAKTLPQLAGSPLYHWSRLELKRFFDIDILLTSDSASQIRSLCNEQLASQSFTARSLLKRCGVSTVVSSDPWCGEGNLQPHRQASEQSISPQLLPSLRADALLGIEAAGFADWRSTLEAAVGFSIDSLETLQQALRIRLDAFEACGCRLADIGLDQIPRATGSALAAESSLKQALTSQAITVEESEKWKGYWMRWLGGEFARRQWTLQLHLGAQRQTSTRLATKVGASGGYACMGSSLNMSALCTLLDGMETTEGLPRLILYPLNPIDMEALSSVCGSFVEDGVTQKVQLGAAWWYNDHRDGMERQLRAVANYAVLGNFIGMVTDSRSFLSGVRHEYFRRVLCNLIGQWVEQGELPRDEDYLQGLVRQICYENAQRQFSAH
ncbi:glucuronate isomerase [Kiritimatiellota bacterium B12222]|nr:glucuronate isomerase [Kiritimatiellota bacterium B12222]